MELPKIKFEPKSLLSFMIAVSLVGWLFGTWFKTVSESIGNEIIGICRPIFIICFL